MDSIIRAVRGLTISSVATAGALLFTSITVGRCIYYGFFHPLASVPGPWYFAVFEFPFQYYRVRGRSVYKLRKLHEKYGHAVRTAPNSVSFTSEQAWKDVANHRDRNGNDMVRGQPPSIDERAFGPGAIGIIASDSVRHARLRKQLAPAFSEKALRDQRPLILSYVDQFMSLLKERAEAGAPIDLGVYLNWLTFDIAADLTFGSNAFHCLDQQATHPWVQAVFTRLERIIFTQAVGKIMPWMVPVARSLMPKRLAEEARQHNAFTKEHVDKRVAAKTERPDFTAFILRETKDTRAGAPSMYETGEIYSTSATLIGAGSETTSNLLAGTIYQLARHPEIRDKLNEVIRTGFNSESEITTESASQKTYMIAVLNEVLRTYPVVPNVNERRVPVGGAIVDGVFLPAGTYTGVCQYAAYYSARNFHDPTKFDPERWMGTNEAYADDIRGAFQPFGIGSRQCIGMNLAYMEMRVVLARFIWNFDVELQPGMENWLDQKAFINWNRKPLMVKLSMRSR